MSLKLLFLDIETAPHKAYVWGLYDQNVSISQIVEPGYTMCWAAKWHGSRDVMFSSMHKQKPRQMILAVHKLLDEADAVVHFNGRKFDVPTLNKEFLLHDLPPPSPFKHIDLLQTCRREFKFASNKLDFVAQFLGQGSKVDNKGMELWRGCMDGDAESWAVMERYNKHDVRLTERIYNRLLPWIKGHPNMAVYGDEPDCCPNCGKSALQSRGYARTAAFTYKRFQCMKCGKWSRSTTREKFARPQRMAA